MKAKNKKENKGKEKENFLIRRTHVARHRIQLAGFLMATNISQKYCNYLQKGFQKIDAAPACRVAVSQTPDCAFVARISTMYFKVALTLCRWCKWKIMENKKDQLENSKQGSGSAEHQGQDRSRQKASNTDIPNKERQNIANEIGEDSSSIIGLKDMGSLSGRDDSSGGSGDRMERENTGKQTDR